MYDDSVEFQSHLGRFLKRLHFAIIFHQKLVFILLIFKWFFVSATENDENPLQN